MSFSSKKNKPFRAMLVVKGDRVEFEFENKFSSTPQQGKPDQGQQVKIRVESTSPGSVFINIHGPISFSSAISFGLVPSRVAECLGIITAAKFIHYYGYDKHVSISANNKVFVQYALRETTPAKKEVRQILKRMWKVLSLFESWDISYVHQKRSSLKGGVNPGKFPRGIFPGFNVKKEKVYDKVYVSIPDPEVQMQFQASITNAQKEGEVFAVPVTAEKAVDVWVNTVSAISKGGF